MSATVDVTCTCCDTLLGSTNITVTGTHRSALQDAISDAGWPIYEKHAPTCTSPLTGASWLGRVKCHVVDVNYTVVQ